MDPLSMAASIGTGLIGGISSLFGGNKAAEERRKMERYLSRQETENKAWYNANALSDYTQRADTQNLMKQLRDNLSKQNKAASNMAVVTGATTEQQAVQKELSNNVISDTYSNIGAMGQQWKDHVTDRYLARKNELSNQRMSMMEGAANSYENLMNNGLNALGGSLGGILGGLGSKSSTAGTTGSSNFVQSAYQNFAPQTQIQGQLSMPSIGTPNLPSLPKF